MPSFFMRAMRVERLIPMQAAAQEGIPTAFIVNGDGKCGNCEALAAEDDDGHVFLGHVLKPY